MKAFSYVHVISNPRRLANSALEMVQHSIVVVVLSSVTVQNLLNPPEQLPRISPTSPEVTRLYASRIQCHVLEQVADNIVRF
jgi:hypothetical protein